MTLNAYKDGGVIEAEVIMMRMSHAGSFLILEGDDDSKFWTSRIAVGLCELVDGNGKPNVERALERLDRRRFQGALGIVDDDFDSLQGRPRPSRNLIATDAHDLECLLLRSPALERVLAEQGSRKKIQRFEQTHNYTVRDALLERGVALGQLRWLALRKGKDVPFSRLRPQKFLDRDTWDLSVDRLHEEAIALGLSGSPEDLRAELHSLPRFDPWSVCQGHDLVSILRIGLSKVLGSLKASKGVDDISAMLRSAFDDQHLHGGYLGAAIRAWEQSNEPYRVL
jgi:hypothetical protein